MIKLVGINTSLSKFKCRPKAPSLGQGKIQKISRKYRKMECTKPDRDPGPKLLSPGQSLQDFGSSHFRIATSLQLSIPTSDLGSKVVNTRIPRQSY